MLWSIGLPAAWQVSIPPAMPSICVPPMIPTTLFCSGVKLSGGGPPPVFFCLSSYKWCVFLHGTSEGRPFLFYFFGCPFMVQVISIYLTANVLPCSFLSAFVATVLCLLNKMPFWLSTWSEKMFNSASVKFGFRFFAHSGTWIWTSNETHHRL